MCERELAAGRGWNTAAIPKGVAPNSPASSSRNGLQLVQHPHRVVGLRRLVARGEGQRVRLDPCHRAGGAGGWRALGEHGDGVRGDRLDLLRGALELVVGEHGRSLEGQVAMEIDPGPAAVVLGPHLHVTGRGMR